MSKIIGYKITLLSSGWVVLAERGKGLCALYLGEGPEELFAELKRRFPFCSYEKRESSLFEEIVERIERGLEMPVVELDEEGTPFQKKVWAALRELKWGERVSYGEIAARIGSPKAMRAVGAACGANPVAIITPCHRVVKKGGDVSGFRWGVEVKRRLLEKES